MNNSRLDGVSCFFCVIIWL